MNDKAIHIRGTTFSRISVVIHRSQGKMIVKKLRTLVLYISLMKAVSGASISNVFLKRETLPSRYYPYYTSISSPQYSQINAFPAPLPYADPCGSPCVIAGQPLTALRPSENVITYNSPYPTIPVVIGSPNEESNSYQYSYIVYDENTGDHKTQRELSDGSVVRGEYSFVQPDGYVRKVQYVADDSNGFNAVVKNYVPAIGDNRKIGISHQNEHGQPCHDDKKESLKHSSSEVEATADKGQRQYSQKSKYISNILKHVPVHTSEKNLESTHIHSSEQKQISAKHELGRSHETGHNHQSMNSNIPNHSDELAYVHSAEHNHKSEDTNHPEHRYESYHNHKLDNSQILGHILNKGLSHTIGHGHEAEHNAIQLSNHTPKDTHEHTQIDKNSHELDKNHNDNYNYEHKDVSKNSHEMSNEKMSKSVSHEHDIHIPHDLKIHEEHNHDLHSNVFKNMHNGEGSHNHKHIKNLKSKEDSEEDNFRGEHEIKSHHHSRKETDQESYENEKGKHAIEHKKGSREESYYKNTHNKKSKHESADEYAFNSSNEKHKKNLKQGYEEQSSEESQEELEDKYHKNPKNNRKHHMKHKNTSDSSESDSEEHFRETLLHSTHKQTQDILIPKQQVVVPYHDVVRCLQNAVRKSYESSTALREDPSPLSQLVFNKPC